MSTTYDITIQLKVGAVDGASLAGILAGVRRKAADIREQENAGTAWWAVSAEAAFTSIGDGLAAERGYSAGRRHGAGVQIGDGNTQVNQFGSAG